MSSVDARDLGAKRGRGKRRDSAATRRRLLQAAEIEFAAQGYQGARLRNIAARAGVQSALIHHYFVDKSGLYQAMLGAALEESSTQSWAILEKGGSVDEMVDHFVNHLLVFNDTHKNLLTILRQEARTESAASELTRRIVQEQVAPVVAATIGYLESLRVRGEIRDDCDLEELIMTTMALCSYPFTEQTFLDACMPSRSITGDVSREARRARIVDTVVRLARV